MGAFRIAFAVVLLFILLELAINPFKQGITLLYKEFFGFFFPGVKITWECTALDEVLLVISAVTPLLWDDPKKWVRGILKAFLIVQSYNAFRIIALYFFPDALLHEILFRLGGLLIIILAYLFAVR